MKMLQNRKLKGTGKTPVDLLTRNESYYVHSFYTYIIIWDG